MVEIDELMNRFCTTGAAAVKRYFEISGEGPWTMPEYFMPAFIMDRLGDETTATLETNFSTLATWNADIRKRNGLPVIAHDESLLQLAGKLKGRRVDMVLFQGQEIGKPKDCQDFYALVEFKGGWLDADTVPGKISDRDKLFMLLAHIDTCPWGIVCGWASKNHRDWQYRLMQPSGDRWYEQGIDLPEVPGPLYFCARVFETSAKADRLRELVEALPTLSAGADG